MSPGAASRLPLSIQLVGVDGGATNVRAQEVEVIGASGAERLRPGRRRAARAHATIDSFEPPSARGIDDPSALGPIPPAEREQGWAWIESTARCILEIADRSGAKKLLLGLALPGAKSDDGRGIAFSLHGPRIPNFAQALEDLLASEGVELAAPIDPLLSDGWCCGLGERSAENGALHGLRTAYYAGGGTGLAEALVLSGDIVPLRDVEAWFPPAWRLHTDRVSFEARLSARSINRAWADLTGLELPLEPGRFPEDHVERDPRAKELFRQVGGWLAELVSRRAVSLRTAPLDANGPFVLERVVLGQHLGRLFADERTQPYLRATFEHDLDVLLSRQGLDPDYPRDREGSEERRALIRCSRLEHAAAIGAAASAWQSWSRAHA